VEGFADRLPIRYQRISEPGVVVARNACLTLALASQPDYLAFIDDDELPQKGWLANLVSTLVTSNADFATGPVLPVFATEPPSWLADYFRKSGHDFCTSNLIVRSSAIPCDPQQWFNMIFNRSGGEDAEFLSRLASSGARHSVAVSAWVHEAIPSERLSLGYLWKRSLRDGVVRDCINRTQSKNTLEYAHLSARLILLKTAYGINHLAWSIGAMPRLYRAADDLAVAVGALASMFGYTIKLYGKERT
jgi:succinoglycan biosynthesis protein ExoM